MGDKLYMNKFKGVLICTDLDGTLLRGDKSISAENKAAIEYFKSEGGKFTVVTGRMPYYAYDICRQVKPNVPLGCVNGGGLYDTENKKYIWKAEMPSEVYELVGFIDKSFPSVGIQVVTYEKTFFCKENETMKKFRRLTGVENIAADYNDIKIPVAKIVFGSEAENDILGVEKALLSHPLAYKFDFIRSEKTLFEILPKGIGKGTAIEKLKEYSKDIRKTVAVGDYNNDISMFLAADMGIAVSNACKEAKEAADFITCTNEEDAIKQVIFDLEAGKFEK